MNALQLAQALPVAPVAWLNALLLTSPKWGVNTPLREAHFVAQLAHESAQFTRLQENLNYAAPRILAVWPKRFSTVMDAMPYEHNPEKLANRVYASRLGNGDELSGDGWRFRGRGPIQITGRFNYTTAARVTGCDIMANPDFIVDNPFVGCNVAGWFWSSRGLNDLADKDDLEAITKIVNGSLDSLAARQAWLDKLKGALT